jgi:hypothetical protein
MSQTTELLKNAWDVLLLFVVPVGGGIPAGVILAKSKSISWVLTSFLYFISDLILACVFEPLMLLFLYWCKKNHRFEKFRKSFAAIMTKTISRYGVNPSPFNLIMITFGTDPMTGRSVAKAAGHGFVIGWALTIAGDMLFFFVIMASTLWLNQILGDGTWTVLIITALILGLPPLIEKWRARKRV